MPTRLVSVVVDSADPPALARWWATALGWSVGYQDEFESDVAAPDGEPGIELTFVRVRDAKLVKNRIHLDLISTSGADQRSVVERLRASGAIDAVIGQTGDEAWQVLVDPEGNEFCVLEPRAEYDRAGPVAAIVVDALDPAGLTEFWRAAAGWEPVPEQESALVAPGGRGPFLEFISTKHPHTVKNRLHLDVRPWAGDDQAAEVARLTALGAVPADVGQSAGDSGEVTWTVLADPEGNEFCVLRPHN